MFCNFYQKQFNQLNSNTVARNVVFFLLQCSVFDHEHVFIEKMKEATLY